MAASTAAFALALVLLAGAVAPGVALAATTARTPPRTPAAARDATGPTGPTGAAGTDADTSATQTAGGAPGPSGIDADSTDQQSAITSGGDPLVANGLGSVVCTTPQLASQLTPQQLSNCQTSSFVAAAAPTGNYAFDIHIDTGFPPGANTIALLFQEFVLTPVWLAFVWIIHSLIVALEWCYTLDLLQGPTLASVTGALHQAQATVTQPWLAAVLSVAALLALYHGVVRRRVAATVGEAVLAVLMMAGGLWVIFNPAGTVGAVAAWSNEASLGALATVSQGSPAQPAGAFAADMQDLFAASVQGPWCYLEFGDVEWCRDPAQVNPQLREAAQVIAGVDQGSGDPEYRQSATLLRRAQSNGDFFLALPANTDQRNAIASNSMFLALCRSVSDTNCQGSMVAEAEFRTASGTWPRAGGLLLIAIGLVGLIAMLAFITMRLLGAAVASLLLLLLAPLAVLAPALGFTGRNVFRAWAVRLLGAFTAKLLYSVLLGVVLLVLQILTGLASVGWWVQWLLISTLWWSVFHHRHRILHLASAGQIETSPQASRILESVRRRRPRVTHGAVLRMPRRLPRLPAPDPKGEDQAGPRGPLTDGRRPPRWRRPKPVDPTVIAPPDRPTSGPPPPEPGAPRQGGGARETRPGGVRDRAQRLGDRVRDFAARRDATRPDTVAHRAVAHERLRSGDPEKIRAALTADRERLARITRESELPATQAQPRRRASLARRAQLLTERIGTTERQLRVADFASRLTTDPAVERRRRRQWAKLLDRQGERPPASKRPTPQQRRDYAALAPVVGVNPGDYERLAPNVQLRKRAAIDRALANRQREAAMARRLKRVERAAAAAAGLDLQARSGSAPQSGGGSIATGDGVAGPAPGGIAGAVSGGVAGAVSGGVAGAVSGGVAGAASGGVGGARPDAAATGARDEVGAGGSRPRHRERGSRQDAAGGKAPSILTDDRGRATRAPGAGSSDAAEPSPRTSVARSRGGTAGQEAQPEAAGRRRGDDRRGRMRAPTPPDGTELESTAMRRERQFMRDLEARGEQLGTPPPRSPRPRRDPS